MYIIFCWGVGSIDLGLGSSIGVSIGTGIGLGINRVGIS
jgi:hypothetical protein